VYFDQSSFEVRCEWGLAGIEHLGRDVDVIIVVDVLSFSAGALFIGTRVDRKGLNSGREASRGP
jgi:2-phosphosulfolactate phosphatase